MPKKVGEVQIAADRLRQELYGGGAQSLLIQISQQLAKGKMGWLPNRDGFLVDKNPKKKLSILLEDVDQWDVLFQEVKSFVEQKAMSVTNCFAVDDDSSWCSISRFLRIYPDVIGVKREIAANKSAFKDFPTGTQKFADKWLRQLYREHIELELPLAPPESLIKTVLHNLLEITRWEEALNDFIDSSRKSLLDLKCCVSCRDQIKGGIVASEIPCYFLFILTSRDIFGHHFVDHEKFIEGIDRWAPGIKTDALPSTGSKIFDYRLACDVEFRCYTPGSGQTLKPGSHGHNRHR